MRGGLEENHGMTHNIIVWIRTGMSRLRIRVTRANQSVRVGNMGAYGRCALRSIKGYEALESVVF